MLEVDIETTIKTLYQKGYNKTQTGRMLTGNTLRSSQTKDCPLSVSIRIHRV